MVLSGAGGSPIRRLQWIERTAPAQGDELARWVHAERDPAVPPRGTPMIESYLELIGTTARVTQEHEILVAVQVDARRVRDRGDGAVADALVRGDRAGRQGPGGGRGHGSRRAQRRPARAGAADRVRPLRARRAGRLEAADPERDGLAEHGAWPLGLARGLGPLPQRRRPARHLLDRGWPRIEVSPMFMNALLGSSSAVRSVAVTFEPLAERALDPRDRGGGHARPRRPRAAHPLRPVRDRAPAPGARRDRAPRGRARRRSRRGPAERLRHRLRPRRDDLRRSCAEVLDHAARAHLELHRLYGQQADAFTFTLPLCRGLR